MKKVFVLVFGILVACSEPQQGGQDASQEEGFAEEATEATELTGKEILGDLPGGDASHPRWKRPKGYATLVFCVDDSANKTYRDGQIKWTGSFKWNAKDNTIVYASSWLPTDGPFVPLYDDGPISEGGHEAEGSVAGDHKFCAEVYFKADKDYTIEYGALDEFDHWIWVGPNGTVEIPKGSTDTYHLKGLTIHKFGETDVKLTLDLNALHNEFSKIDPSKYDVYVKTSANSWTPVQLLDNGKNGDEEAGDGVYTYLHSTKLGPHDGLCYEGQHVQFVFVFALKGFDPEDGQEYKVGPNCAMEGVKAYTDFGHKGEFEEAPVVMERDSRGKVFNTTVIIGGGRPWCTTDEDCFEGTCKDGGCEVQGNEELEITSVEPAKGPASGGTQVTIKGKGFKEGAEVLFGDAHAKDVNVVDEHTITCTTPEHTPGKVDLRVKVEEREAVLKDAFEFEEVTQPRPSIKDVVLQDPLSVETIVGVPTQQLHARVVLDVPEGVQEPFTGLVVQVGYGPQGSNPLEEPEQWSFVEATKGDCEENACSYMGVLQVASEGTYSFTFRASFDEEHWSYGDSTGLEDGFSPADLGTLTVSRPQEGLRIDGVNPPAVPVDAPGEVEVYGSGFKEGIKVYVDDAEVQPSDINSDSFKITLPDHTLGWASLKVVAPEGKEVLKEQAILYVPFGSPVMDGSLDEWKDQWRVASNELATNWTGNELHALYVAYDKHYLYIGVDGFTEKDKGNFIVGYLDVGYPTAQGVRDMNQILDNEPATALDDAISSKLVAKDEHFAAQWAFGSKGMKSYTEDQELWPASTDVGWRKLENLNDLAWIKGNAVCSDTACEFSIPLTTLFGNEPHSIVQHIALFVAIVNDKGDYLSNQGLPQSEGDSPQRDITDVFLYLF